MCNAGCPIVTIEKLAKITETYVELKIELGEWIFRLDKLNGRWDAVNKKTLRRSSKCG